MTEPEIETTATQTKISTDISAEDVINKIKEKAVAYAKSHAADNAKKFYLLGKRDAAVTFLTMIQSDGWEAAIADVAKEVVKHEPDNEQAQWILKNQAWKKPMT